MTDTAVHECHLLGLLQISTALWRHCTGAALPFMQELQMAKLSLGTNLMTDSKCLIGPEAQCARDPHPAPHPAPYTAASVRALSLIPASSICGLAPLWVVVAQAIGDLRGP
ncbi:hypothetical protein COCON_G00010150 [Conger conger]|uniref:Uncharacterized protein n=1 Tax=Conger conger TaxID=82655 RepID=A0A9Q1E290_CONCO|nr:hypothetical protein COCON_G00010150 [Conger conger]